MLEREKRAAPESNESRRASIARKIYSGE